METRRGVEYYDRKLKQWKWYARILRWLQVILALTAIISSVLASSKAVTDNSILSVVAAASVAIFTGLSLTPVANRHRAAWRMLNCAILKHRESGEQDIGTVREAYSKAEEIIGDYEPTP
ncbi:MAG: hypothetical protein H8D67_16740 [Deltaproteobacteria bacterium]|nr:hypothetical protein [Deltaproteobacteria bacterium]